MPDKSHDAGLLKQMPDALTMVITELDIGGAEQAFVRVAIGLQEKGWNVDVVSLRDRGPLSTPLKAAGIEVTALNSCCIGDLRTVLALRRHFRQKSPAIAMSFLHEANLVTRAAGCLSCVRKVVSGIRVADRRIAVWLPERLTRRCVDRYIAVSGAVGSVHCQRCRIPAEHMSVIPNGVDTPAIDRARPIDRNEMGCRPEDFVFLCAGRLTEQKAPEQVLEAFVKLRLRSAGADHARLWFVGDGPLLETLRGRIQAAGLESCVWLAGWRADIWNLMKSSDCLVLASLWEGAPNVILEAQAAGLPVIGSAVDGTVEFVTHSVTGRLFPAGDTDALAEQMQSALQSPEASHSMMDTARSIVKSQYSWEICVDRYHNILQGLLRDARESSG